MKQVCKCKKGYANPKDSMCRFCREETYCPTRAMCSKFGIKRREGLTYDNYLKVANKALWLVQQNKFKGN